MALSDFTIVTRSLATRRLSSVTTIAMVAVGVALMLVLLMMRSAASGAFERGAGTMHVLISNDVSPMVSVLNGVFYANPPRRPMTMAKYESLRAGLPLGDNGFAVPTLQGDSYLGLPVMATSGEFFTRFRPAPGEAWATSDGRLFDKPFEVVLGSTAARVTRRKVGQTIYLAHGMAQSRQLGDPNAPDPHVHKDFAYTVVGTLAPTGTPHDRAVFTDLTSSWIIHAHDRRRDKDPSVRTTTADDLTDADRLITGIYVGLATREGSSAPAALQQVFARLRQDPSITVASPSDEARKLMAIIGGIDWIFIAMAAVVMVSSGVGIMLALYNSMEQRRRQVAVLRVLGAGQWRIAGLALTESCLIAALGATAGVVLALVGARLAAEFTRRALGLVIDPALPARHAVVVGAGAILLGMLAGVVPAVMAYRTSVARNLRPIA